MTRLSTSIAPPGLNGETRRIGLVGQAPAGAARSAGRGGVAEDAKDIAARAAAKVARVRADRRSGEHMGISALSSAHCSARPIRSQSGEARKPSMTVA